MFGVATRLVENDGDALAVITGGTIERSTAGTSGSCYVEVNTFDDSGNDSQLAYDRILNVGEAGPADFSIVNAIQNRSSTTSSVGYGWPGMALVTAAFNHSRSNSPCRIAAGATTRLAVSVENYQNTMSLGGSLSSTTFSTYQTFVFAVDDNDNDIVVSLGVYTRGQSAQNVYAEWRVLYGPSDTELFSGRAQAHNNGSTHNDGGFIENPGAGNLSIKLQLRRNYASSSVPSISVSTGRFRALEVD